MTDIKAILFDFGGTLDSDGIDWFCRFYREIGEQGGTLPWETFEEYASRAAHDICALSDTPRLSLEQMAERLCEEIHKHVVAGNGGGALGWTWQQVANRFVAQAGEHLRRSRAVLGKLSEQFRLGCISNNWGNTAGWCRDYQLDDYFETMIDSTVVGASKPDKVIFHKALDELQLPPEACAYVGDKYDSDILGARGAGLLAIWVTGQQQEEGPAPEDPVLRIASVVALPDQDFSR